MAHAGLQGCAKHNVHKRLGFEHDFSYFISGSSLGFTVDLAFSWPANRQILKVDPILEVDPTLEVDPKKSVRESHSESRST